MSAWSARLYPGEVKAHGVVSPKGAHVGGKSLVSRSTSAFDGTSSIVRLDEASPRDIQSYEVRSR